MGNINNEPEYTGDAQDRVGWIDYSWKKPSIKDAFKNILWSTEDTVYIRECMIKEDLVFKEWVSICMTTFEHLKREELVTCQGCFNDGFGINSI